MSLNRRNLIILGVLDSLGYTIRINKGIMQVIIGSLIALNVKKVNWLMFC